MDSSQYQQILDNNVHESVTKLKLRRGWIFQQDNDPKHRSKSTQAFMQRNNYTVLEWPSQSPDLNIIEHLILIFSPDLITSVKVFIDGNEVGEAVHSSGPLYVLQWMAEKYKTGLHEIKVKVTDAAVRSRSRSHLFSLDDDADVHFSLFPTLILLMDHYVVSQVLFILTVLSQFILLIIYRIRRRTILRGPPGYCTLASFSMHVLSKNNTFFYAMLLLNLYTAVGTQETMERPKAVPVGGKTNKD
ncbi:unnamed protein product [Ranitomeya imitator]|uniref:Tc1-like transposase DDE domain-containing protein n=1 Tax=Ranitomeya imitator TaxID=111125 RepID=A0ABN9LVK2_9NEOB|nr:unnamed protein product [Ranitomeya imitator]